MDRSSFGDLHGYGVLLVTEYQRYETLGKCYGAQHRRFPINSQTGYGFCICKFLMLSIISAPEFTPNSLPKGIGDCSCGPDIRAWCRQFTPNSLPKGIGDYGGTFSGYAFYNVHSELPAERHW